MKKNKNARYHNRRYYLHRILKNRYLIDAETREVDIYPYQEFNDIPVPDRYYIGQLIKLGYNIQLRAL